MAFANTPTERELEILAILWERGSASVRDVFDLMRQRENLAQNTVQTFLRVMEEKGLVAHETQGRAFIYRPLYSRQRVVGQFVDRVFNGAVGDLVLQALQMKRLSAGEISAIEQMIQQARQA